MKEYKDYDEKEKSEKSLGIDLLDSNFSFVSTPLDNPVFESLMRKYKCHNTYISTGKHNPVYLNGWELLFKMAHKITELEEKIQDLQAKGMRNEDH